MPNQYASPALMPLLARRGALNYGNLQLPPQGPLSRNNPYGPALQQLLMQGARPATPGMQGATGPLPVTPQMTPAAQPDPFTALAAGANPELFDSEAMQMLEQPETIADEGIRWQAPEGPLNAAAQSQYGNPNDPLMAAPGGGPAVMPLLSSAQDMPPTQLPAAAGRGPSSFTPPGVPEGVNTAAQVGPRGTGNPYQMPGRAAGGAVRPPALTPTRETAPIATGRTPGASSPSGRAVAGGAAGVVQPSGSPTIPPRPALDPRRSGRQATPSVTPTSSDPRDRSPENTAADDAMGFLGLSDDAWESVAQGSAAMLLAGEEGMSTLGALGAGVAEGLGGHQQRRRERQEAERQRELEDRSYALDERMQDLRETEANRPSYDFVTGADGQIIAINRNDPSQTIGTGVTSRTGRGGSGAPTIAQRLQMVSAASDLISAVAETGAEPPTMAEAMAIIEAQVMGGSAGGGGTAAGAAGEPPTDNDIQMLLDDPTPEMQAYFDEAFGAGAAARVLGGG